jgi:hypothetical protein
MFVRRSVIQRNDQSIPWRKRPQEVMDVMKRYQQEGKLITSSNEMIDELTVQDVEIWQDERAYFEYRNEPVVKKFLIEQFLHNVNNKLHGKHDIERL